MNRDGIPEDPAKQWEVLLCIIAFEEKRIDNRENGDTLNYIFNHVGIRSICAEWIRQMRLVYDKQRLDDDTPRKDDQVACLWRSRGNVKFRAELFEESHQLYTKCILLAHKGGEEYSVALGNRSAVCLRLKRYKESLRDLERALNHNYPPKMKHKLFLRRAECYSELGLRQECFAALKQANKQNEILRLWGPSKAEFDKTYTGIAEKARALPRHVPIEVQMLPELFTGENPQFKNACNAVELVSNDKFGRHVIVKEPVKRGDLIFAEEPFASVKLLDQEHSRNCDYCCASAYAMVGCDECSRVLFCDEACYHLGRKIYHQWECPGMRANIFPVIGLAHLAFRVVLKYTYNGFPRLPPKAPIPTTAYDLMREYAYVDKINIYRTQWESFYSMFNLATNFENTPKDLDIQFALTSTMLTMYLEECTTFFEYFTQQVGYPLPLEELKLLFAGLIFRTLGQLVINAHTITELSIGRGRDIPDCFLVPGNINPWKAVGTGVYPSASMMNHSCEPNITNLFYKNLLFVKVIRELTKGGEILNCYGPHYAKQSTEERQEILRVQYGFNCKCPACLDDTRKDFVSLFSAYACSSCKGPVTWVGKRMLCHACPYEFPLQRAQNTAETAESMHATAYCKRCDKNVRIKDLDIIRNKAHTKLHTSAMRANTHELRCERMVAAYRLMQQVLYRHNDILRVASDDLAMLYACVGDYTKSIDLMKQNIQSYEYQYGSFSVEVTNEIRKMANLMLSRIMRYGDNPEQDERQPISIKDWIRETLKIAKKASQLMELNFGTWQPVYEYLKQNEAVLEAMMELPPWDLHQKQVVFI